MFLCLSLSVLITTVHHLQYLLSVKPFYSLPLLPVQSPALWCLFAFGTSSWSSLTLDGVTINYLLWKGIKNPVGMAITWIFWGSAMTEQWSWGSCKQRLQSGPAYWFSSTMAALNFSSTWHHTGLFLSDTQKLGNMLTVTWKWGQNTWTREKREN